MKAWVCPQAGQRPRAPRAMAVRVGGTGHGVCLGERSGCHRIGALVSGMATTFGKGARSR